MSQSFREKKPQERYQLKKSVGASFSFLSVSHEVSDVELCSVCRRQGQVFRYFISSKFLVTHLVSAVFFSTNLPPLPMEGFASAVPIANATISTFARWIAFVL
ncbi:MAG: hypothetical protein LBJ19_02690, partial [Holosporaceae bacterium]|nr:hypothetical protein [Holosporaceae bacterium]